MFHYFAGIHKPCKHPVRLWGSNLKQFYNISPANIAFLFQKLQHQFTVPYRVNKTGEYRKGADREV